MIIKILYCLFPTKMSNNGVVSPSTLDGIPDQKMTGNLSNSQHLIIMTLAPAIVIFLQIIISSNSKIDAASSSTSSSLHYRRRIQHVLTGLIFYTLSFYLPFVVASLLLIICTGVFYALHFFRSKSNAIQNVYMKFFGPLLRDHEKCVFTLPGAFWFLFGTMVTVIIFPMDIARTSLLCLSFGDPIAAIIGINVGGPGIVISTKRKSSGKTLSGSFACFCICYLVSYKCMGGSDLRLWLLTGYTAAMMEAIASYISVDDNVLIPVGTGAAIWLWCRCINL